MNDDLVTVLSAFRNHLDVFVADPRWEKCTILLIITSLMFHRRAQTLCSQSERAKGNVVPSSSTSKCLAARFRWRRIIYH